MNGITSKRRALGVISLALITAGSVDSVRNLPTTALFGSQLVFFFLLAAIFFLLPSALISAELASTSDDHGGVYVWVKNAFGLQSGLLAIWFQWIENVIWYPTILAFVGGTIGYLISPTLIDDKVFLISVILCAFWGATIVNLRGIHSSALFSNFCITAGLLVPMLLIISLGAVWLFSGKPLQIHFTAHAMLPHLGNADVWVALTGIILSFCGMEIATVHSADVNKPQSAYPRAMLLATLIIVVTLICGALSIAIVLPSTKISLVAGLMQAFNAFFAAYHLHWILPIVAILLVIGGMGGVSNWIIAPTRGLLVAAQDGVMPEHLKKVNRFSAPTYLLIYQAVIVTFITLVFLLFPNVNASYWLLTALSEQLYMFMYLLMFSAAICLRYKNYNHRDGFRIPGGRYLGMWIVGGMGVIGALVAVSVGFIPPPNINIGSTLHYETLLITGLVLMSFPPFLLYQCYKKDRLAR